MAFRNLRMVSFLTSLLVWRIVLSSR